MSERCTRETRRCEFWTRGESYVRPDCCTGHLKELLFFTHSLLTRHGIRHWLDFGALLGAVRTGEFIPWDADVDFGIMQADLERVRALKGEIEQYGYRLDTTYPYVWRILLSDINTQHADLFPWRAHDGMLQMHWPGHSDDTWAFPSQMLESLHGVELYRQLLPAPAPVSEFLSQYRYGSDYQTPQRPEQITERQRIRGIVAEFVAQRRQS